MSKLVLIPRSHNTLDVIASMYGRRYIIDVMKILKYDLMVTDLDYIQPVGKVYTIPYNSGQQMLLYQEFKSYD